MGESFAVDGNRLRLLTEGPERLDALIALIDGARVSLRLLYYIYIGGDAGALIRDALIRAIGRGVAVTMVVDGMGSEAAETAHFFDPLEAAGGAVCHFVPRLGRRYLLRNHQKLALADDRNAIIGGFNVGDDYFGTPDQAAWRDLGLLIEGPAAAHLAGYFDALHRWAVRPRAPMRLLRQTLRVWSQPRGHLRWLFGGPTRRLSPWALALKRDMRRAHAIHLIAGYFAPNPAMLRRLQRATRRGLVRIVLPAKTDHGMAIWASRFTYAGLIRNRVEIYEYQRTKLHTKLVIVDDAVYVGSANYDIRSLYLNLELMLRIDDPAFAAHARNYVDGEVAGSLRITDELNRQRAGWWTRARQAAAYFVMAVVDLRVTRRLNIDNEPG